MIDGIDPHVYEMVLHPGDDTVPEPEVIPSQTVTDSGLYRIIEDYMTRAVGLASRARVVVAPLSPESAVKPHCTLSLVIGFTKAENPCEEYEQAMLPIPVMSADGLDTAFRYALHEGNVGIFASSIKNTGIGQNPEWEFSLYDVFKLVKHQNALVWDSDDYKGYND